MFVSDESWMSPFLHPLYKCPSLHPKNVIFLSHPESAYGPLARCETLWGKLRVQSGCVLSNRGSVRISDLQASSKTTHPAHDSAKGGMRTQTGRSGSSWDVLRSGILQRADDRNDNKCNLIVWCSISQLLSKEWEFLENKAKSIREILMGSKPKNS